jgi:hypothetical protein
VFLEGVAGYAGQRNAAPSVARCLAARQPDRELLGDRLRVLLERLEERPDLVEEYCPGGSWALSSA